MNEARLPGCRRQQLRRGGAALGFTLVELLVVVGIVTLLVAILLPTLQRVRQVANDIVCASTMRQALAVVLMYNGDYKSGLQNYDVNCPMWGRGWQPGNANGGPHHVAHLAGVNDEAKDYQCSWRGYLLNGRYASYKILGCTAHDYRDEVTGNEFMSYNSTPYNFFTGTLVPTDPNYPDEGNYPRASFKERPAYVWYGPGIDTYDFLTKSTGGPISGSGESPSYIKYSARIPLFACPTICYFFGGVRAFELPHRPQWNLNSDPKMFKPTVATNPFYPCSSYAGNIGFTDGSVVFYESKEGKSFTW